MACDVHIYNGEPRSADVNPPVILGHEYSGIIEEVGSAVVKLKVGDHVTVDPNMYCGDCIYCHDGKNNSAVIYRHMALHGTEDLHNKILHLLLNVLN